MRNDGVKINLVEMREHAGWWDGEAAEAQQRNAVDPATLAAAQSGFGKIGSSTVGAALAEVYVARDAYGRQLSREAAAIAGHIRADVDKYETTEEDNRRLLQYEGESPGMLSAGGGEEPPGPTLPPYPYPEGGPSGPVIDTAPAPQPGELPPYPYPEGGPSGPVLDTSPPAGELPPYPYPQRGPYESLEPDEVEHYPPGTTVPANR